MRVLFFCIVLVLSSYSLAENISEVLIPESLIGESMRKEVDWLIEDVDTPKTDFGKALAEPLKTMGVNSSVSATYESISNETELYSLEIYEFVKTFTLDESVGALKPGVIEKSTTAISEISGYPTLTIAVANSEIQLLCIKAESYLVIVSAVNNSSDIRSFARKYIKWFSTQTFSDKRQKTENTSAG